MQMIDELIIDDRGAEGCSLSTRSWASL